MSETSSTAKGSFTLNINRWMDGASLSGLHWRVFTLCVLILTFDGYDLFVYSGSIPLIMRDFHMNPMMAGAIASYMLFGALIGAFVLGSLADIVGRKRALLFFIALFSIGMFMTSRAHTPMQFAIWRFITGLGVGASQPNVSALSTEFSPRKGRGKIISTIHSGMSVGGVVAALLSICLYAQYTWRSVYLAGSATLIFVPIMLVLMPESPVRLMRTKQFDKVRALMRKLRPQETVPDNCELEIERGSGKAPIASIFMQGRATSTVLFWVVQFMNSYGLFGFTIWLPKLIMSHGYSLAKGLTFLLAMSAMAIVGSFFGGILADKLTFKFALVLCYLTSFVTVTLVGFTSNFALLMLLVCLAGAAYNGAQNLLNSYLPPYYPPSMRSTASSVVYGLSRIGALTGPMVIGIFLAAQFSYQFTLVVLASPVLISVICILLIQEKYSFSKQLAAVEDQLAAAGQKA